MNVLVGGIFQETNTFSAIPVIYEDFRISRGEAVLRALPECRLLKDAGHTVIPAVFARILPSAPLNRTEFEKFIQDFWRSAAIIEKPDAIYLSLHGGMYVKDCGSGELLFLECLREKYGWEIPIFVSFDFHGNMFPELAHLINYATAYKTAPHVDERETGERAVRALIACLKNGRVPGVYCMNIPMTFPGEMVMTQYSPSKEILQKVQELTKLKGVLEASWFCGFVWSDAENICMSIAVSAFALEEVEEIVKTRMCAVADYIWNRRDEFHFQETALETGKALKLAVTLAGSTKKVFVSDSGDNVTAGAAGDNAFLAVRLNEILEKKPAGEKEKMPFKEDTVTGCRALVTGIADKNAVEVCFGHEIDEVFSLTFGGSLDKESTAAVGIVKLLGKGTFCFETNGCPVRFALIKYGCIEVLLVDRRFAYTRLCHFVSSGVDCEAYDLICVKLGYLYPELAKTANQSILALTPGNAPLDVHMIPYKNKNRRFYPRCKEMTIPIM